MSRFLSVSILGWLFLLLAMPPHLRADIIFLNDGTILGGKILAEDSKAITFELREIRVPKSAWSAKNFLFAKQKVDWAPQELDVQMLYVGAGPLLSEASIPQALIKQKQKLFPAEIRTRSGSMAKDLYRKTEYSVYYYDLGRLDSNDLREPASEKAALAVREDIQGEIFFVPPELRPGLQRVSLSEVISIHQIDERGKKRIYPETRPWLSQYVVGGGYSLFYPVGATTPLGLSPLGFTLSASADLGLINYLPQFALWKLRSRVGLLGGWQLLSYETTFSTTDIHLFPLLLQTTLYYDLPREISGFRLAPFLKLGNGVIISSAEKKIKPEYEDALMDQPPVIQETYIGYAFQVVGGMELYYRSHPQIRYGLEAGYLFHAEKVSGHFITLHLSVGYRFSN